MAVGTAKATFAHAHLLSNQGPWYTNASKSYIHFIGAKKLTISRRNASFKFVDIVFAFGWNYKWLRW
jgi:hypothetical protein